ncbi:ATP-binding protein [Streptomyces sp. NBC_01092]|uniref:ATP-binding protein n=1 Tax=Streptomyces sp. NBC_01092 TaxID=2903748 RepID=UPI003869BF8F|nr:ATP-binding protein [Streptomyces sp. NBC_01092]
MAEIATLPDTEIASASLMLEPALSAPRRARSFARESLCRWGEIEELIEAAVLIVSELATNAVCHGASVPAAEPEGAPDSFISLTLALHCESLQIEVFDGSSILPVRRAAGHESDCGRGIMIIEALAGSWASGLVPDGGKWVRASLPRAVDALAQ